MMYLRFTPRPFSALTHWAKAVVAATSLLALLPLA